MFNKIRTSGPHSTVRVILTTLALVVPFVYAVYHWARAGGSGTKLFDSATLGETIEMDVLGLLFILVVGKNRCLALFEHFEHLVTNGRGHRYCVGDAFWAFIVALASAISGGVLFVQTIYQHAPGQKYTRHFEADIGTPQFYKSGYQALAISCLLVLVVYLTIHFTKRALHGGRSGVQLPVKNARTRGFRSRKALGGSPVGLMPQGIPDLMTDRFHR